jgi:hypothetical protein
VKLQKEAKLEILRATLQGGCHEKKQYKCATPERLLHRLSTEATSLDWKISVFGKSQCSATAC